MVLVRKRAFESRFSELLEECRTQKKDDIRGVRSTLHGLFHSLPHPQEHYGALAVSPDNEARGSSSTLTLHSQPPANEKGQLTADLAQVEGVRNPSSHFQAPADGLKVAIASELKASLGEDEFNRSGCLTVGRVKQSVGTLSKKNQLSAPIEPFPNPSPPSTTLEDGIMHNQHEQCDPKPWSKQDRVDKRIPSEHIIHKVTNFPLSIDDVLSRTFSNYDARITREDRMQLGGVEYGAIKLLAYLIPAYFILWQLIGSFSSALYIVSRCGDIAKSNAINPWYVTSNSWQFYTDLEGGWEYFSRCLPSPIVDSPYSTQEW